MRDTPTHDRQSRRRTDAQAFDEVYDLLIAGRVEEAEAVINRNERLRGSGAWEALRASVTPQDVETGTKPFGASVALLSALSASENVPGDPVGAELEDAIAYYDPQGPMGPQGPMAFGELPTVIDPFGDWVRENGEREARERQGRGQWFCDDCRHWHAPGATWDPCTDPGCDCGNGI